MASFEGMLVLLDKIGFFSVIVPFILVYVIIFALLEKTKVLGTIDIKVGNNTETLTRSNFNAIVAFSISILFVVAKNLVFAMQEFMNWVVILIILSMSIVLAFGFLGGDIGEFFKSEENKKFMKVFKPILLLIIILIMVIALIKSFTGVNVIQSFFEWIKGSADGTNSDSITALLFFLVLIGVVAFITKKPNHNNS
ncbi:MAG: hypothetical protein PHT94_03385 [Candidatus Nanoarchaeia archaeon]|nr:hypothetical protein [Candidatus Nanoarchaeia archaeon]